jgi:hypothetical protein
LVAKGPTAVLDAYKLPAAHIMAASLQAFGLSQAETTALTSLAGWLQERSGAEGPVKAVVGALLSVEPKVAFSRPTCFKGAARKLLRRYVYAHADLVDPKAPEIIIDDSLEQADCPTDLFTGDELAAGQDLLYAVTDVGAQESLASTADSWLYHMCINGPRHPANRASIAAFGRVGLMGAAGAGAQLFTLPPEVMGPLMISLMTPNDAGEPEQQAISVVALQQFEAAYGIPPERQLSRQILPAAPAAPPAGGAAAGAAPPQLGPAALAILSGLFGPQVAALLALEDAANAAEDAAEAHMEAMGLDVNDADNAAILDNLLDEAMEASVAGAAGGLMAYIMAPAGQ